MAALLMVASLLPLAVATLTNIREARTRMRAATADLLTARGDQLAQRLDTFHAAYQRSAHRIAHLPDVVKFCRADRAGTPEQNDGVRTLLEVWQSSDAHIRGIAILDNAGTVKGGTEEPLIGVSLSCRRYVQEALGGAAAVSDIHLAEAEVEYTPTVAYLSPVVGPAGNVIGIVNISVRASAFWDVMKASNELAGLGSSAEVFDRQGIRIAHTRSDDTVFHPAGRLDPADVNAIVAENRFGGRTRQLLEDVRAFPEQFDRARAGAPAKDVFRAFAPATQSWTYGVARRFETVPWTVFYTVSESSIDTQIAQMTRQKAVFAGVIAAMALLAGALFAAVILKPIRLLAKATDAIAAGDMTARVPEGHADEIGQLGASFNLMAARMQTQAAALLEARDRLETRVQERTAELVAATRGLAAESAERKAAVESLRKSEAQLKTIVDNVGDGVVVADLNGEVLHFNQAALKLHGYSDISECLRHLTAFTDTFELSNLDGSVLPTDQWPLARVLRDETLRNLEVQVRRHRSNWQRTFSYGGTLVRGPDGRPLMAILTISDATERRRAAEKIRQLNTELELKVVERTAQLQTANNELEAFSFSVSHDLRAPLRSLDGFSQALMEDCAGKLDAEAQDHLRRIRGASQRMGQLIDDLINLSRTARVEMVRQTVDLSKMAREVAAEVRTGDRQRRAVVTIAEGLTASADPRLLRIALTNLLSNAWKFTGKQPEARIEFGSEGDGGDRLFFVRDNGAGFDMAHAGKLFGAFQRLHAATDFAGTGIGLATVHRIVHRHGGRIWARSAVGEGAAFFFTLNGGAQ
jgi:signal transduction histidine kinase